MTKSPPPILLSSTSLANPDQAAIVDTLQQALDLAKAGEIDTVGVVVCLKGGFASHLAGSRAGDLYLGCADLMDRIKDSVRKSAPTKKPTIYRG